MARRILGVSIKGSDLARKGAVTIWTGTRKHRIKMSDKLYLEWFELGADSEILKQNIHYALAEASGENDETLTKAMEELEQLLLTIKSGDFEEDEIENAFAVWNHIYELYEEATVRSASSVDSAEDKAEEGQR